VKAYGVKPSFVVPGYAFWEALRQRNAHVFFAGGGGEHQGRFGVVVPADALVLVALLNEELLVLVSSTLPIHMHTRTAICVKPFRAARCRLVLLLSSKSGLRSLCGLFRMMRATRGKSLRRMARRRRRDTSILSMISEECMYD
jgi:hypothetical protein